MLSVYILAICQSFLLCSAAMAGLLASIIGYDLAPHSYLITLPITSTLIGNLFNIYGAVYVLKRLGRQYGSTVGALLTALASGIAIIALLRQDFWLFVGAHFLLGMSLSFVQQYRFAAAEAVEASKVPKAVALLLFGSIFSAFVGPYIGVYGKSLLSMYTYVGSYSLTGVLALLAAMILFLFKFQFSSKMNEIVDAPRPLLHIFSQPRAIMAVVGSATSYAIMSFIMVATPISMHKLMGYPLEDTSIVIQAHIIAMFLPSLVTGTLIQKFGEIPLVLAGAFCFLGCVVVGLFGELTFLMYVIELVLLGLGWNLMFISSTTLLTKTYRPSEQYKVQATNDVLTFSSQVLASLLAGALVVGSTWKQLNVDIAVILGFFFCAFFILFLSKKKV